MNKTVSISLSGQVFQIDEQAYETLKSYLENIRRRFATAEGGQEIIADIESRIAELFLEKLNDRKQVITPADVDAMMSAMGKPEDFETAGESAYSQTTATTEPIKGVARRLFRDPDEKVLGGVCSGLSAYFGIKDPIWMRILFIISPFLTVGTALVIYIILWIIIPEAKTSSEKLQMRGEHVNISNIEKTIREDLNDLGNRISDIGNGSTGAKAKGFLREFIDFCIAVLRGLIKIAGKIIGVLLVLAGLGIIIGIMIAVFLPAELTSISIDALYPAIFTSQAQFFAVVLGFALVVIIPALALLFSGFHLLIETKRRIKGLGLAFVGLFILGTVLFSYAVTRTVVDFQKTGSLRNELQIEQPVQDTLTLEGISKQIAGDGESHELPEVGQFTETDSLLVFTENVRLDIKKSTSGNYELIRTYKANGGKVVVAERRANNIRHEFVQNGDVLTFDENISVPKSDHYRVQEVDLLLKVPEGKAVFLAESVKNILYDVQNTHDMYDGDMVGHTWIMLPEGLTCLDCTPEDISGGRLFKEGSGVNRKMEFKDFTGIDARGAFNLEVKQGEFSVNVNGNEHFIDEIEVSQDGSRLAIQLSDGRFWSRERGTVTVSLPELEDIQIAGTTHAAITGFKQERMAMEVKGASKVDFKSSVDELELEEAGASTVTLSGTGTALNVEVSGSSELRAFSYEVQRCEVEVSGASDAEINVQKEMTVEANGASKVRYKGLPKILSSDVAGYSSIKPEQ